MVQFKWLQKEEQWIRRFARSYLGGVGEVGKNSTIFEYDDQMLMVDAGVKFPEAELHGVDLVIPNFGYVTEAADDLRAIIVTHGHEDHIGALPFLLMQMERSEPIPIYGTQMTLGLIDDEAARASRRPTRSS